MRRIAFHSIFFSAMVNQLLFIMILILFFSCKGLFYRRHTCEKNLKRII